MALGSPEEEALRLISFLASAPTPYHAARRASEQLVAAGFSEIGEGGWRDPRGAHCLISGGSLFAFLVPPETGPRDGLTLVAAHTDSPGLRLRPHPDLGRAGYRQLAVEVYGRPLLNSWLDRDLGLAGRAAVRTGGGVEERLFTWAEPVARLPQLAVHLDPGVNERGLVLNPQTQLVPIWGLGEVGRINSRVAAILGVEGEQLLALDAMLWPLEPPALAGADREFVSSARLDNLLSCYCAIRALVELATSGRAARPVVVALFDHEEVGSVSSTGAAGRALPQLLERLTLGLGGGRAEHLHCLSQSRLLSVDVTHAANPNYLERYEPSHLCLPNGGPAIKVNSQQRYATAAPGAGRLVATCRDMGIPMQWFSSRGDQPCGSTIGPSLAGQLAVETIDLGLPVLAMHSARELGGAQDPNYLIRALLAAAAA
ncbi:MAG: M18 family aminopeptidase [Candidatus Dormibacteraeota bacterium]|nr:M18 family aminopeptidase [Candidatus Dormibacteraeota bacterium]